MWTSYSSGARSLCIRRHPRVLEALSLVSDLRQMERFESIISCIWSQLMSAAGGGAPAGQQQAGQRSSSQVYDSAPGVVGGALASRGTLLQATMQLVNSLISAPSELNFRVHLRNEFMRAGLADMWPVCACYLLDACYSTLYARTTSVLYCTL